MAAHASMVPAPTTDAPARRAIDDAFVDEIAAETISHRNTVIKRLAGLEVRGIRGRAIDAALAKRGVFPRGTNG